MFNYMFTKTDNGFILVGYVKIFDTGNISILKTQDILQSNEYLSDISSRLQNNLKLIKTVETLNLVTSELTRECYGIVLNPFIQFYAKYQEDLSMNEESVRALYNVIKDNPNIKQNIPHFSLDLLKAMVGLYKINSTYSSEPFKLKICDMLKRIASQSGSQEIIDMIEKEESRTIFKYSDPRRYNTKLMANDDDTLFIKFPSYESISTKVNDLLDYTDEDGNAIDTTEDDLYFDYPLPEIDSLIDKSKILPKEFRNYGYKTNKNYGPQYSKIVEGNPDNNDLTIQDNESLYFKALNEYINFGFRQQFGDNLNLTEIPKDKLKDSYVMKYVKALGVQLGRINWGHTGLFTTVSKTDGEYTLELSDAFKKPTNQIIDGIEGAGVIRDDVLACEEGVPDFIDIALIEDINELISENVTSDFTFRRVCETIIKLARWGNRKPTQIKISEMSYILELNTFMYKKKTVSFDRLTPQKVNGYDYGISKLILSNSEFTDNSYIYTITGKQIDISSNVIGIACKKLYVDENNTPRVQTVFMSLIDVLELIKANPKAIEGIELNEDGTITASGHCATLTLHNSVDLHKCLELVNKSIDDSMIFYSSKNIRLLGMHLGFNTKNLSYLNTYTRCAELNDINSVFNSIEYDTKEEYIEKSNNGVVLDMLATYGIADKLLPTLFKYFSINNGETDLGKALMHMNTCLDYKFELDLSLSDQKTDKPETSTTKMSLFNQLKNQSNITSSEQPNTNVNASVADIKSAVTSETTQPFDIKSHLKKFIINEKIDTTSGMPLYIRHKERNTFVKVAYLYRQKTTERMLFTITTTIPSSDTSPMELPLTAKSEPGFNHKMLISYRVLLFKGLAKAYLGVQESSSVLFDTYDSFTEIINVIGD